jgi:uncharacterized SAM-binding protein YcdF (DUF218 family)
MLFSDVVEWGLPTPLHLLGLLAVLAAWTWTRPPGAPGRRWRGAALAATGWCLLCTTPAVADRLVRALEGDPAAAGPPAVAPDPTHRIIVLSSGEMTTPDGAVQVRLSRDGWERIHGGVALWRQIGGTLVFTGGPDGAAERSLAARGAALAQELGVPASAILVSPIGETTAAELHGVAARLAGHGGQLWLVTSALHRRRAELAAAQAGLTVRSHPVGFRQIRAQGWWVWVPSVATLERLVPALHEWVGLAVLASGWQRPGRAAAPRGG